MALPIYDDIPELSTEAKAIARRRKIAESMMAQSQAPLETNQMAGGYVVPVSWTQGLAKLAQAYLGNKTDAEADKSERGLADKYKNNIAKQLADAELIARGTPAIEGIQAQPERTIQAPAPMQQGQVAPNYGTVPETVPAVAGREAVPAVAGDKRRANEMLVASAYPEIQRIVAQRNVWDTQDATQAQSLAKLESERNKPINVAQGGTIYDPKTGQAIFSAPEKPIASSGLAKLINERNSLPEGSPLRATYDEAIKKETTATEPLVMTVNAQGVPTYTPRGQAAGSMPYVPTLDANAKAAVTAAQTTAKVNAESQAESRIGFPKVITDAEAAVKTVDKLLAHPGFGNLVGLRMPGVEYIPGTETAGAASLLKQVTGKAFLTAFETLKGGGQITEIEGTKATTAINRMSQATSEADFKDAAQDYKDAVKALVEIQKNKANFPTQKLPKGIPQGAVLTDEYTTDGRQLYKSLDGKYHTAD